MQKLYGRTVAHRLDHKPVHDAVQIRGFVPVIADWVKETTVEDTFTVSLSDVISTAAVAVALVQRLQDDAVGSSVTVAAKASVSTNSAAQARLVNAATSSIGPHIAHCLIPVNEDREVMWTVFDSKGTSI